ncbi:MAG TPA: DNA/RNA nuclease SfsA [Beijerinckiaceae bacterium]|nr:DNA/RNA nuclease SfsA [Beijerinckiaceae bacterium]
MRFPSRIVPGRLIQRYKRFLAEVALADGSIVTAHCANPGAMLGLTDPGSTVWLSMSPDPKRKLAYNWELVEVDFGDGTQCVGINTSHPNRLAELAISAGTLPELAGYPTLRREVRYGVNSRIDLLLEAPERAPCYVEVKNVHLCRRAGQAEFPDCVTARGAKHLGELANVVRDGGRAVMLYVIQMRADSFSLAADIDPAYARAFDAARAAGVEALAYSCDVSPDGLGLARAVPFVLG